MWFVIVDIGALIWWEPVRLIWTVVAVGLGTVSVVDIVDG